MPLERTPETVSPHRCPIPVEALVCSLILTDAMLVMLGVMAWWQQKHFTVLSVV